VRYHPEILVSFRIWSQQGMKSDICESRAAQQRLEAVFRIQPLGIELIGYNSALCVDDDLPANQPVAILG
jgi:hypothetical protein